MNILYENKTPTHRDKLTLPMKNPRLNLMHKVLKERDFIPTQKLDRAPKISEKKILLMKTNNRMILIL